MNDLFSLAAGAELRDRGKDQVEGNNQGFVPTVREALQDYCLRTGRTVTNDDARRIAAELGLTPTHKNAWGAIFRGRGWKHVGWRASEVKSNHAHSNREWRYEP